MSDDLAQISNRELALKFCQTGNSHLELAGLEDFADTELLQQALECFLLALELEPQLIDAYLGLAYLSSLLGNQEQALQALNQATLLAPEDPRLHVLRQEIQHLPARNPSLPQLASVYLRIKAIHFVPERHKQMPHLDADLAPHLQFLEVYP